MLEPQIINSGAEPVSLQGSCLHWFQVLGLGFWMKMMGIWKVLVGCNCMCSNLLMNWLVGCLN